MTPTDSSWIKIREALQEATGNLLSISEATAGLKAVVPLIKAQRDRGEHANAYAEILQRYEAVLATYMTAPEPTITDFRFRALQLAVEYAASVGGLPMDATLTLAETFRAYLETGVIDE